MREVKWCGWEKMVSFVLNSTIFRAKLPASRKACASKAYAFLGFISDLILGELAGVFIKTTGGPNSSRVIRLNTRFVMGGADRIDSSVRPNRVLELQPEKA
jgi:hypothetical protein